MRRPPGAEYATGLSKVHCTLPTFFTSVELTGCTTYSVLHILFTLMQWTTECKLITNEVTSALGLLSYSLEHVIFVGFNSTWTSFEATYVNGLFKE